MEDEALWQGLAEANSDFRRSCDCDRVRLEVDFFQDDSSPADLPIVCGQHILFKVPDLVKEELRANDP
jgi:hypothetical protein